MLKNENKQFQIKDKMISIANPIKKIIMLDKDIATISQLKSIITTSPLHFTFGFNFYNYFDVLFEYSDEKLKWKAFSCKYKDDAITDGLLYTPDESAPMVTAIDNMLKPHIPLKYLKAMQCKNYQAFEKRTDFKTVPSKKEFNELKNDDGNDDFKTTDECLEFMEEKVKQAFGANADNFKVIDNYNYHGWHINFTFEAYKTFTVKIIHELADGAQIIIGDMEHYFNIPMSADDFGRCTSDEFLSQLKENLELRLDL